MKAPHFFVFSSDSLPLHSAAKQDRIVPLKKGINFFSKQGELLESFRPDNVSFSILFKENERPELHLQSEDQVFVQSAKVKNYQLLNCHDSVQVQGGMKGFLLESFPQVQTSELHKTADLEKIHKILEKLSQSSDENNLQWALNEVLTQLAEMAGAEVAFLLTEDSKKSEWKVRAKYSEMPEVILQGSPLKERREIFSQSVLNEALKKRELVFVENALGSHLSRSASMVAGSYFSVAAWPLLLGKKIFGAVFLGNVSPGKSLENQNLSAMKLLSTQAALMTYATESFSQSDRKIGSKKEEALFAFKKSKSPLLAEVISKAEKLAPSNLTLLIYGESGTGKELLARAIHEMSGRMSDRFVSINCSAIPDSLMESMLFGYEKGAFTGATDSKAGLIEAAHQGTLFLDEIAEMSPSVQAKFLRVLQEKKIERLGSSKSIAIDLRVLAATHSKLPQRVKEGRFREDLYFRLFGAELSLPSLRLRKEDIPALVEEFCDSQNFPGAILPDALQKLLNYNWPGNIRELKSCIERAVVLKSEGDLAASDIYINDEVDAQSALGLPSALTVDTELSPALREAQSQFTKQYVSAVLKKFDGNRTQSAAALGISERSLYRILADNDRTLANYV